MLYEQLISEGYTGSYSTVQRYIKVLKRNNLESSAAAYIPMQFESGEKLQELMDLRPPPKLGSS